MRTIVVAVAGAVAGAVAFVCGWAVWTGWRGIGASQPGSDESFSD